MHVDKVVLVFKDCAPWAVFVIFLWGLLLLMLLLLFARRCMFFLVFLHFLIRSFNRGSAYVGVHHFFIFFSSDESILWSILFLWYSGLYSYKSRWYKSSMHWQADERSFRDNSLDLLSSITRKFSQKNYRPFLLSMERDVNEPGLIIQADFQRCLADFLCVFQDFWSVWH